MLSCPRTVPARCPQKKQEEESFQKIMVTLTLERNEEASDDEDDVFGELPNQDPTDTFIDQKDSFLWLINNSRKVGALYNKKTKQDILASAVFVGKPDLFLQAPVPSKVVGVYSKYSKVTRNKRQWVIASIAEPLYLLGRHLFNLCANNPANTFRAGPDRLDYMYEFVAGVVEEEEAQRKAKDDRAKAIIAKKKRGKKKENPLPDDFVRNPSMKADIDCPGCGCKGTVKS